MKADCYQLKKEKANVAETKDDPMVEDLVNSFAAVVSEANLVENPK